MAQENYYTILGVPRNATPDEIKKAYRRLAMKYHPDHNPGDPLATKQFQKIQEAYSILSDPAKRTAYDWDMPDDGAKSSSQSASREREEARRRAEKQRRQENARRKAEEARRNEEEARRREYARQRAEEARREAEENRRREYTRQKAKEEARRNEEEARRREYARQRAEQDRARNSENEHDKFQARENRPKVWSFASIAAGCALYFLFDRIGASFAGFVAMVCFFSLKTKFNGLGAGFIALFVGMLVANSIMKHDFSAHAPRPAYTTAHKPAVSNASPQFDAPRAASAAKPSFNCSKARHRVEKMVCNNPYLASLEQQMANSYRFVINSHPDAATGLKKSQLAWLSELRNCTTETCIADAYRARIWDFTDGLSATLANLPEISITEQNYIETRKRAKLANARYARLWQQIPKSLLPEIMPGLKALNTNVSQKCQDYANQFSEKYERKDAYLSCSVAHENALSDGIEIFLRRYATNPYTQFFGECVDVGEILSKPYP